MYDAHQIEKHWLRSWEEADCFIAPDHPNRDLKFFNYDSGPFPSGPLHMGHVRTYVLGDLMARYQRLLGKTVLYATEFDAFGLPNELAALEQGVPPREFTQACIRKMREQMKRLGISYDWKRIPSTCDPDYYQWTQWLFLWMYDQGLVKREAQNNEWCPKCETTLAPMQIEEGCCWRCGSKTKTRSFPQWTVNTRSLSEELDQSLDKLIHWSASSKKLLHGYHRQGKKLKGWCVSRQRSWGAPIPMVYCKACQILPDRNLPVLLPDGLDWSLGANALKQSDSFVNTQCPGCGGPAKRETDTLDCFFDDIWCFMACLRPLTEFKFTAEILDPWMPMDCFHSGFDTFTYLHLHRLLGHLLHSQKRLSYPEPISRYVGHDMVLANGRKMSKHLGNAMSPDAIMDKHGADVLRLAVIWAAGPHKPFNWNEDILSRSEHLVHKIHELYLACAPHLNVVNPDPSQGSKAIKLLKRQCNRTLESVRQFIQAYRPNGAVEKLAWLERQVSRFALHRIQTHRLKELDGPILKEILNHLAIALSPFAPFLAEEVWRMLGNGLFICKQHWPESPGFQY